MKSHLRLLCYVFGLLTLRETPGAEGANFFLDNKEVTVNGKSSCGILRCLEEARPDSVSNISSLTLYKQKPGPGDRQRVTLATISQGHPLGKSTLDGVEVDGMWTAEKVEMKASLIDEDDCRWARLSCQVNFTDGLGKERVSVSHVEAAPAIAEESPTPAIAEDAPTSGTNENLSVTTRAVKDGDDMFSGPYLCPVDGQPQSKRLTECLKNSKPSEPQYQVVFPKGNGRPYLCDTNGGWVVIQHRSKGDIDFLRDWNTYKNGFGRLDGDFWLGNDMIHTISTSAPHKLLITMKYDGKTAFAQYDRFSIEDEKHKYRLNIGNYSGTAGDGFKYQNRMAFSTVDRENDPSNFYHCAQHKLSAWWYFKCTHSNLNGVWGGNIVHSAFWIPFSKLRSVTFSEMKIRPVDV